MIVCVCVSIPALTAVIVAVEAHNTAEEEVVAAKQIHLV